MSLSIIFNGPPFTYLMGFLHVVTHISNFSLLFVDCGKKKEPSMIMKCEKSYQPSLNRDKVAITQTVAILSELLT